MKRHFCWGIFLPVTLLVVLQAQKMDELVPKGFTPAGAATHFGTPDRKRTDGSIFDYMDGGGIVYLDHGFRELVHREFLDACNRRITYDHFTMETAEQALAALADPRIAPTGGKALLLGHPNMGYKFPPDYFIFMVLDKSLIYLHVDDAAVAEVVDQFAADILKPPKEEKK